MVEMAETNYALRHADDNSLLIFDEIGRGTASSLAPIRVYIASNIIKSASLAGTNEPICAKITITRNCYF